MSRYMHVKIFVFWNVMPCTLVASYQQRGMCSPITLLPWRWWQ